MRPEPLCNKLNDFFMLTSIYKIPLPEYLNWIIIILFIVIFAFIPHLESFLDISLTQELPDVRISELLDKQSNSTSKRKLSSPIKRTKEKRKGKNKSYI